MNVVKKAVPNLRGGIYVYATCAVCFTLFHVLSSNTPGGLRLFVKSKYVTPSLTDFLAQHDIQEASVLPQRPLSLRFHFSDSSCYHVLPPKRDAESILRATKDCCSRALFLLFLQSHTYSLEEA